MRDPNPVVVLIPGIGRITFAADKTTARLAGEFYGNAINVMRGAEAIGGYLGLPEQEAYDIEYWALEEAKLQRMPRPRSLAGKIALVTGGAGGIGVASAERLLADGACVMLVDRDATTLSRDPRRAGAQVRCRPGAGVAVRRDRREPRSRPPLPIARANSAGSTSWSSMPASPPPRRSRKPASSCGAATMTCWRRAIS